MKGPSEPRAAVDLTINGTPVRLEVPVRRTLADAIREHGLTGTHLGCEHGVCGACTVLLDDEPVRSCLMLTVQAAGRSIRTIEGLTQDGELHPMQEAFHKHRALQCGFCTPGFVMLAVSVLERDSGIGEGELRSALASNVCRCTGYTPIVQAVLAAQRGLATRA